MADYHLSAKTVSRSDGRSATAAAAYRAGAEIVDERTGQVHDYTRKSGVDRDGSGVVLPAGSPEWAADRAALWNAAEQAEKRKNSTVAREFEIALPHELDPADRAKLAHDFATEIAARHGCAVDVCIHAPSAKGDQRNHHAHLLMSTRRLGPDGFGEKTRELDDMKTGPAIVTEWRARWAEMQNERLAEYGHAARVDHRSLAVRRDEAAEHGDVVTYALLDRLPTVKRGPAATAMQRRGEPTKRGRLAEERKAANVERLATLAGELAQVIGLATERERREAAKRVAAQPAPALDLSVLDAPAPTPVQRQPEPPAPTLAPPQATVPREPPTPAPTLPPPAQPTTEPVTLQTMPRPVLDALERKLTTEVRALAGTLPNPGDVANADPRVRALAKQIRDAEDAKKRQDKARAQAEREVIEWRRQHGLQAKLHDSRMRASPYVAERAELIERAKLAARKAEEEAGHHTREANKLGSAIARQIEREQKPQRDALELQRKALKAVRDEIGRRNDQALVQRAREQENQKDQGRTR